MNPVYDAYMAVSSWFDGFWNKRLWHPDGHGRKTVARENVSEESALNYSAVWCATQVLCGTAASLPFPLYRGLDGEERTKDRTHPVSRILNRSPNGEMPAYNFRSVMWQWQVNWGNAYAEIEREGNDAEGALVALHPLHPSRVEVKRDGGDGLIYEVKNGTGRESTLLDAWQMFHVPSIITTDGISGRGVIQHARESIGAGIAAEKYGANWFGGAAVPRVVIEHKGNWPDENRAAFRKEWDEIHSGAEGSRIALLGGGAVVKPLSLSAEDSQFLETRNFGIEEIARWYNIPPHMLQHLLRATFNNVEELGANFVRYSLIPWLRIWEQCVSQKLLTESEREDYFAEHNVDALQRGNIAARASFYQTMTTSGIMTRNECRKLENMDPLPGGDTALVQGAMVPLDEDGKPVSDFAGTTGKPQPAPADVGDIDDLKPPAPQPTPASAVVPHLHSLIQAELSRFHTKETKAMLQYAKKPDEFLTRVDEFYQDHTNLVRDSVAVSLTALASCGVTVSADVFVTDWITSGRALMVDVSGTVKRNELAAAVKSAIESKTWTERPFRAVERVRTCSL